MFTLVLSKKNVLNLNFKLIYLFLPISEHDSKQTDSTLDTIKEFALGFEINLLISI